MAAAGARSSGFVRLIFRRKELAKTFGITLSGKLLSGLALAGWLGLASLASAWEEKVVNIYKWSD